MSFFERSVLRVSGNERINMLGAWHGTSEAACYGIAEQNFRMPPPFFDPTLQKDPGYFGQGVYFTQFPSYGDKYVKMTEKGNIGTPLLLSFLLMGTIYPVTEHPLDPNSLSGKPCKEGYNSHYAIVKAHGLPCKINEIPEADEFVVFKQEQILPRYLVYYHRKPKFEKDIKKPLLLWVDDKPYEHANVGLLKQISDINDKVQVQLFTSSTEVKIWLEQNRNTWEEYVTAKRARIITNRYRQVDGGEYAGQGLIEFLMQTKIKVPILLYCKNTAVVKHVHQPSKKIYVTENVLKAVDFATFKDCKVLKNSNRY